MIGGPVGALLTIVLVVVGVVVGVWLLIALFGVIIKALGYLFGFIFAAIAHVFGFVAGEISDVFRLLGAVVLGVLLVPMVVGNIVIGRWSASSHFGSAFKSEVATAGACVYRIFIGRPAKLLLLTPLTEGLEQRLPEVIAAAPTRDTPRNKKTTGKFDGYNIVGSLTSGGSGSKLYVAEPDDVKLAAFTRNGQADVDKVVIKTFSLGDGSSLPQIVRESRALDSAKKLGLVLEHELNDERFYYVMRYVPGKSLSLVTQDLHAAAGSEGLDNKRLRRAVGFVEDLLETLAVYHSGGLWHKDVKPDNIIVEGDRAHLVDLGLVTPLRSAMTLTTHGTEYFRDPELVRMALKGVKVHQVDGGKFDVYAAGAVLYSVIENSFPAHGGLSHVRKRCPEALRWVVRRSMAEYDQRYATCDAMLADLRAIAAAEDPFALKPIDLPSMNVGGELPELDDLPEMPNFGARTPAPGVVQAAAYQEANDKPGYTPPQRQQRRHQSPGARPKAIKARKTPKLNVVNWWTGGYVSGPAKEAVAARRGSPVPPSVAVSPVAEPIPARPLTPVEGRARAHEQLASARARAAERRQAAQSRARDRRHGRKQARRAPAASAKRSGNSAGVVAVLSTIVAFALAGGIAMYVKQHNESKSITAGDHDLVEHFEMEKGSEASAHATQHREPAEIIGTVLLIEDFAAARRLELEGEFTVLRTEMAAEGWELIEPVEAVADARYARDRTEISSVDAKDAMKDWLSENDQWDAVLWIEPSGESDDGRTPFRYRLFSKERTFGGNASHVSAFDNIARKAASILTGAEGL